MIPISSASASFTISNKEKLDPANWSHTETHARSHGRNEHRQTIACHYLEWMDADIRGAWTGLETLIMVSRDRDHGGPKGKVGTHYCITSLKEENAAQLQRVVHSFRTLLFTVAKIAPLMAPPKKAKAAGFLEFSGFHWLREEDLNH